MDRKTPEVGVRVVGDKVAVRRGGVPTRRRLPCRVGVRNIPLVVVLVLLLIGVLVVVEGVSGPVDVSLCFFEELPRVEREDEDEDCRPGNFDKTLLLLLPPVVEETLDICCKLLLEFLGDGGGNREVVLVAMFFFLLSICELNSQVLSSRSINRMQREKGCFLPATTHTPKVLDCRDNWCCNLLSWLTVCKGY